MFRWFAIFLVIVALGGALGVGSAVLWPGAPPPPPEQPTAATFLFPSGCKVFSDAEAAWGIQVLYTRLSRDRSRVTVRYRVIDAERAARFHRVAAWARLVDPVNRVSLPVSGGGALPAARLGAVHDLAFPDPDREIGLRRRVTLEAASFRLPGLVVRG